MSRTVILRFCFRRSKLKVKILFSAAIARPKASHHLAHRSPQHPAIDSGPKWVEVQKKIQYEVYDDVNNKMVQLKALINCTKLVVNLPMEFLKFLYWNTCYPRRYTKWTWRYNNLKRGFFQNNYPWIQNGETVKIHTRSNKP